MDTYYTKMQKKGGGFWIHMPLGCICTLVQWYQLAAHSDTHLYISSWVNCGLHHPQVGLQLEAKITVTCWNRYNLSYEYNHYLNFSGVQSVPGPLSLSPPSPLFNLYLHPWSLRGHLHVPDIIHGINSPSPLIFHPAVLWIYVKLKHTLPKCLGTVQKHLPSLLCLQPSWRMAPSQFSPPTC